MSANTSSVPCFSLYNLDLQRNVRYTQPLSTIPSDGTDKMYLRMTLLGAAIALNQCTQSTTQETEQRLPLSFDTGDRQFTTLNTLFISYSNIPRCTNDKRRKIPCESYLSCFRANSSIFIRLTRSCIKFSWPFLSP